MTPVRMMPYDPDDDSTKVPERGYGEETYTVFLVLEVESTV